MAVYLIAYDLRRPEVEYKEVRDRIGALSPDWIHAQLSTYLVNTELSSKEIKERLKPLFRPRERLMIMSAGKDFAGINDLPNDVEQWLVRNGYPVVL